MRIIPRGIDLEKVIGVDFTPIIINFVKNHFGVSDILDIPDDTPSPKITITFSINNGDLLKFLGCELRTEDITSGYSSITNVNGYMYKGSDKIGNIFKYDDIVVNSNSLTIATLELFESLNRSYVNGYYDFHDIYGFGDFVKKSVFYRLDVYNNKNSKFSTIDTLYTQDLKYGGMFSHINNNLPLFDKVKLSFIINDVKDALGHRFGSRDVGSKFRLVFLSKTGKTKESDISITSE